MTEKFSITYLLYSSDILFNNFNNKNKQKLSILTLENNLSTTNHCHHKTRFLPDSLEIISMSMLSAIFNFDNHYLILS